jgi:hypothetical protein
MTPVFEEGILSGGNKRRASLLTNVSDKAREVLL